MVRHCRVNGRRRHGAIHAAKGQALPGDHQPWSLQGVASNEMIAGKFREAGFTEVDVAGSGRMRLGTGLWPHDDASAEVPDEVTSVSEIEV